MTLPSFFIIAGEASGDRLGADLMRGLRMETSNDLKFDGVGGPAMQAEGLNSLFNISDLSIMGLIEVIPKIPMVINRINQTVSAVLARRPDVLITIDSPDFCLRVAKRVRRHLPHIKIMHYVAPSVWAWRPGRAYKMARYVDHVLALLPFEPPYMHAAGMSCDFVGHPVAQDKKSNTRETTLFLKNLGIEGRPVITLLPGSRKSEIFRMMPVLEKTTHAIKEKYPDVEFILPLAPNVKEYITTALQNWSINLHLLERDGHSIDQIESQKRMAYAASDLAIATSGTVVLELAAQSCPMVIGYRANWLTTQSVKKMAQIDTANLINIISETRIIPEFLFENCTAPNIIKIAFSILSHRGTNQKEVMQEVMQQLGQGSSDAHLWAARSVLKHLK